MNQLWLRQIAQDFGVFGGMAVVALILGMGWNRLQPAPVPLLYSTKAERLHAQVARTALDTAQPPAEGAEIREITVNELQESSSSGGWIVIDARPEVFHRLGHVPGAISLPRETFETAYGKHRQVALAEKRKPIVIYCQGGECEDSHLVARALMQLGHTHVSILLGGWEEWEKQGNPVERP